MLVKKRNSSQKLWRCRLFAAMLLSVITGTSVAETSGAEGQIGFLAGQSFWVQVAFVIFCWWLLAVFMSMLLWKPLNDAPKAARISAGFMAACALAFMHFYVFAFSPMLALIVGASFVILCIILWYSYSTAQRY